MEALSQRRSYEFTYLHVKTAMSHKAYLLYCTTQDLNVDLNGSIFLFGIDVMSATIKYIFIKFKIQLN